VASSRLQWLPSQGSYFVSARYDHLDEYRHLRDVEFAEMLTRQHGVACIPVSAFYHDATDHRTVRFCFAKKEETLANAARRLQKI
jgi:methionine aminotransferase